MDQLMYNQSIKEEFLSDFPVNTQNTYRRIFIRSQVVEKVLDKDLYNFTRNEIEEILFDLNPLTSSVSQSNGRIISSYISWSINKKLKHSELHPLKSVDSEWFDKFVDKEKKLYFSYKEIVNIQKQCENAQDAVILRLYFEGVSGKDSSEIRNLTVDDIFADTNTLILRDDGKKPREYVVSPECISLVKEAASESTYLKRNGQMVEMDNVRQYTDLVDNKFVIRNSITRTEGFNDAVHSSVIYRRMNMISEILGLPYLTGKNVFRSGMIYEAWKIMEEYKIDILEKPHYEIIARKFGIKNWYSLKEYVNYETITKLYGEVAVTLSA